MTTNGTIKRMTDKGFGFIATAEGTQYFFHQSACAGTPFDELREGQEVSFTVGQVRRVRGRRTSTCGDRRDREASHRRRLRGGHSGDDAPVTPVVQTY